MWLYWFNVYCKKYSLLTLKYICKLRIHCTNNSSVKANRSCISFYFMEMLVFHISPHSGNKSLNWLGVSRNGKINRQTVTYQGFFTENSLRQSAIDEWIWQPLFWSFHLVSKSFQISSQLTEWSVMDFLLIWIMEEQRDFTSSGTEDTKIHLTNTRTPSF